MNINVGVILGSSSGFCVRSVNYVISCKLFRVRLKVGQNWRTRPGLFLSLIRSFRTAGSAPLGTMQAQSAWLLSLTTWITLLSRL